MTSVDLVNVPWEIQMALRSRLPIIGSALFLLLGAGAYFLPTFVPYMAINGINIVEHKDIIAIAMGAVAAIFLLISFVAGRSKSDDYEASDETDVYEEAIVVELAEETPAEAVYQDAYDVPVFDNTVEEFTEAPVKLTSTEKRAAKAAAKAEKKRLKEEAKFAKKAEKEAAKAAKAAEKAAAKGASVDSEILDAETGTDWYKDDEFLTQTVTDAPVADDAVGSVEETASEETTEVTDENWTEAAYTDPTFTVPFADETTETPTEAQAEEETVETEVEETVEAEVENADVVALKAQVAALEAALNDQAQNTQYALLELSEATRSNSTARLEWLKDMVEKNDFGDDVVLRMIDMLIRQSKADEDTVQSAISANDLRK